MLGASRFIAAFRAAGVARAAAWAMLVLVICLGASLLAWSASSTEQAAKQRTQFDFAASKLISGINGRLSDYVQVLWGGVGMFAASPAVTREQWHAYVGALMVAERLPGVRGVGYVRVFSHSEKAAHVRMMREQGFEDFDVWPAGEREQYALSTYIEPSDPERRRVFGFDGLTEPTRRAAMEQARDSGNAVMSGRLLLVQQTDTGDPVGFLIYLPIYRPGLPVTDAAERRAALAGFVSGAFRIKMSMSDALARQPSDPGLAFEIYDGSTADPAALLYRSEDWPADSPQSAPTALAGTLTQEVAGRPWTFRFAAAPSFGIDQQRPSFILFGGLLTSMLAGSVAFVLVLNRAQAVEANRILSADVTRRERVEAQLRESEATFRLLFANNPLPMWAWDFETRRFLEVNNAAIAKYGYSRDEFEQMRITDIRPDEDLPRMTELLNLTPPLGTRTGFAKHRSHDGQVIDVEVVAHDIDLGGHPARLGVMHDITESKKAQEALVESEQLARQIIASALDGFVQINETGTIVECNPQAEAIFAISRADAIGMPFDAFLAHDDQRAFYRQELATFVMTGESAILGRRLEVDGLRRDGSRIRIEVTVTALRRRAGFVLNCFIRDLTEKMAAEEQLRQAQKMEAIGKLTGGIAHDFNNILTVITGTIEILAEAVANQPQLSTVARMIEEAAERGAALTRHLLAFARKQPLRPRPTDVNALVTEATRLFTPALGEDVEIVVLPEADVWRALVDPSQLTTSLLNLAVNARDAMPGGGKLTLETGNVLLDQHYADSHADVQPGSYVRIAVSDTGTGIPAGILDKVFEPFFTTKEVGKGTGLGLSMVYGFVKQSGGHITLYSEEGRGTTIKLYLPRAESAEEDEDVVEAAPLAGGRESILVVEDDALVRDYVIAQLASLGYRTCAAVNAAEALALVDAGEHFDLLFTDVIMPGGMNGKELAQAIAARRGPIKVLFTSGYTENSVVHHGRLDAGVALLSKPYRKTELAGRIREILDKAQPV